MFYETRGEFLFKIRIIIIIKKTLAPPKLNCKMFCWIEMSIHWTRWSHEHHMWSHNFPLSTLWIKNVVGQDICFACLSVWACCAQALQTSTITGPIKGPEGGDEVHYCHHWGATQKLPSLVSAANFISAHVDAAAVKWCEVTWGKIHN